MKRSYIIVIIFALLAGICVGGYFGYRYFKYRDITFIEWSEVSGYFTECKFKAVDQTHGKTVYFTLKDDTKAYSVEPEKDLVIDLLASSFSKCGQIDLDTK